MIVCQYTFGSSIENKLVYFSEMDEELLINLVRERRELYDVEHKLYEDNPRREAAWQEIAKKVLQPGKKTVNVS